MKAIKILLFIISAISCIGCNDDSYPKSNKGDIHLLKLKLEGKWIKVLEYDFFENENITFSKNDTIYQKYESEDIVYRSYYEAIAKDSILIVREWETDPYKKTTRNKIIFYEDNHIFIERFDPLDLDIFPPEFRDIELLKKE